jgi:hypothetical protein
MSVRGRRAVGVKAKQRAARRRAGFIRWSRVPGWTDLSSDWGMGSGMSVGSLKE